MKKQLSPGGLLSKVIQSILFLATFCLMLWFLIVLYRKNFDDIIEGTYVYDRFETPIMLSPLLIIFLLLIYIILKIIKAAKKRASRKE